MPRSPAHLQSGTFSGSPVRPASLPNALERGGGGVGVPRPMIDAAAGPRISQPVPVPLQKENYKQMEEQRQRRERSCMENGEQSAKLQVRFGFD